MSGDHGTYYLPDPTKWPVITSMGLFLLALGFILNIHSVAPGPWVMLVGALVIVVMMFSWFGQVAGESEAGRYDHQVDTSFRMGMGWFIFSEVMFFAAFSGRCFMHAFCRCPGWPVMKSCGLATRGAGRLPVPQVLTILAPMHMSRQQGSSQVSERSVFHCSIPYCFWHRV